MTPSWARWTSSFDSAAGSLAYCGTICLQVSRLGSFWTTLLTLIHNFFLQMEEQATLKPTEEFFNMILYNSDPNSKVFLRR